MGSLIDKRSRDKMMRTFLFSFSYSRHHTPNIWLHNMAAYVVVLA